MVHQSGLLRRLRRSPHVTTVQNRTAASLRAEAEFRARVEELGGEALYEEWRGATKGHLVRCAKGHENAPHPSSVQQGGGICRTCSANEGKPAEAVFRARLADLGATLIESEGRGAIPRHEAK